MKVSELSAVVCDQCAKNFTNVYTLSAHKKQVHEGIKDFECETCKTAFATKYKLKRHFLGVHSDKRSFSCSTCFSLFKTREMLKKHERRHFQGMGPFNCTICDVVFKYKSGLDHHMKLKHTVKTTLKETNGENNVRCLYECSICQKIYKTLKAVERHEKVHHTDSGDLKKHVKEKPTKKHLYCCDYCDKVYKSKVDYEVHIASHNVKYEEEFIIEDCEFIETKSELSLQDECENGISDSCSQQYEEDSENLLKNIDQSLVSVKKIKTEKLSEDFEKLDEKETDVASPQSIDEEEHAYLVDHEGDIVFDETIITEDLELSTFNEDVFFGHSNMISEGQPINREVLTNTIVIEQASDAEKSHTARAMCHLCGASFKHNSDLKRHIQRKHCPESYKFSCDLCGSRFLLNYELKRHMTKHSTKRDFTCEECPQKFKTETSLRNHVKTLHNPEVKHEKVFKCNSCDRSYFHERHLNYHMRKHKDGTMNCDRCEKKFYYSDAVKWHKIRTHGDSAPFNCHICSRKFIHEKTLQSHIISHETSTSVPCPVCSKVISEKRHLKSHLLRHNEKQFNCKCGDSFTERHQLKKHMQNCWK